VGRATGRFELINIIVAILGLIVGTLGTIGTWLALSPPSPKDPEPPSRERPPSNLAPSKATPSAIGVRDKNPKLAYKEPVTVPWTLQYHDDGCGGLVRVHPSEIDFDAAIDDSEPQVSDLAYVVHSVCSKNTRLYTSEEGHGGIVLKGQATDPISCRTAAITGALPSYLRPDTRKALRVLPGNAFCLVTDQGRIVRAEIEDLTLGEDGIHGVITTMSGTALIWEETD